MARIADNRQPGVGDGPVEQRVEVIGEGCATLRSGTIVVPTDRNQRREHPDVGVAVVQLAGDVAAAELLRRHTQSLAGLLVEEAAVFIGAHLRIMTAPSNGDERSGSARELVVVHVTDTINPTLAGAEPHP